MKSRKDKLKLRPTLKEKRHYLIIELTSKEKLNEQDVKNKIESSIKHFIGSLGLASAGPIFVKIKFSKEKYLVTLSVLTKYVDYVKASFTLFKGKDVSMKCVGVSGTIKKSERFLK
jgi:RNase P/RNase MRP subunit POP5